MKKICRAVLIILMMAAPCLIAASASIQKPSTEASTSTGANTLYAVPTLLLPVDADTIQDNLTTFAWSGDGLTYTLQIDTNLAFGNPVVYSNISGTSFKITSPLRNSTDQRDFFSYFWRVQAHYSGGTVSGYSSARWFDIGGPHEVPSEYPDIRTAYQAFRPYSSGTILLAPGTYSGNGNCGINIGGDRGITIVSTGGSQATIIDCQNSSGGFTFDDYAASSKLEGLTIRNVVNAAVFCSNGEMIEIDDLRIDGSNKYGIVNHTAGGTIRRCTITHCDSSAIFYQRFYVADPIIEECTITSNRIGIVAALGYPSYGENVNVRRCILANNFDVAAVSPDQTVSFTLECSDVFGNQGGNYVGALGEQLGVNNNFSSDPLFCNPLLDDYSLFSTSSCAAANNPCGGFVGSGGVGCESYHVWYVSMTGDDSFGNGTETKPFRTIQRAINRAPDHDTVLIVEGTYQERISFLGKPITVASYYLRDSDSTHISRTAINGSSTSFPESDSGSTIRFVTNETSDSRLIGLAIRGGVGTVTEVYQGNLQRVGGGILLSRSSPLISNCQLSSNNAGMGGAIAVTGDCQPIFLGCEFSGNTAAIASIGATLSYCELTFDEGCRLVGDGSGFYHRYSAVLIVNHSVMENCGVEFLGNGNFSSSNSRLSSSDIGGFIGVELTSDSLFDSDIVAGDERSLVIRNSVLFSCNISLNTAWGSEISHSVVDGKISINTHNGGVTSFLSSTFLGEGIEIGYGALNVDKCTFYTTGEPVFSFASWSRAYLEISCSDLFGFSGGGSNWMSGSPVDEYGGSLDTLNLIFDDPLFCNASSKDYTLLSNSPCAPMHNFCGVTIGARGVGCSPPPENVQVTINTVPPGRSYKVDGTTYSVSNQFTWIAGSLHSLEIAATVRTLGTGIQEVFASWSDGGAASHTVAPTTDMTFTATFKRQFALTMVAGPGGSTTPSAGINWYDSAAVVPITATPATDHKFVEWIGTGNGSYDGPAASANVTMRAPLSQTPRFAAVGTATIADARWTEALDLNENGFWRSARLVWDSDVSGAESDTLVVTEKVKRRLVGATGWTTVTTTSAHKIKGESRADSQWVDIGNLNHNLYEFNIEVYREGHTAADYIRDRSDEDLDSVAFETISQDPRVYALVDSIWWTGEVDNDEDGYRSAAILHLDPDIIGTTGTVSVLENLYGKRDSEANWQLLDSLRHSLSGTTLADSQAFVVTDLDSGVYDFKIEVFRQDKEFADTTIGPLEDPNLAQRPFEQAATDIAVTRLLSLSISPADTSLAKGLSFQYEAIGRYNNIEDKNLTDSVDWSSSQLLFATVSADGTVQGIGRGVTSIIAEYLGVADTARLSIEAAVLKSIEIERADVDTTLPLGRSDTLIATAIYSDDSTASLSGKANWASRNSQILTVGATTGILSLNSQGSCFVVASYQQKSDSVFVTVTAPALQSIVVESAQGDSLLVAGQSVALMVQGWNTLHQEAAVAVNDLTWSAVPTGVVNVTQVGDHLELLGLGIGAVGIEVKSKQSNSICDTVGFAVIGKLRTFAGSAQAGDDYSVVVDVLSSLVDSARILFREGGASEFSHSIPLVASTGQLSANLPGSVLGVRGAEIQIRLYSDSQVFTQPANDDGQGYVPLRVSFTDQPLPTLPASKYRMIGFPFNLSSASSSTNLQDDLGAYDDKKWRLFHYNPISSPPVNQELRLGEALETKAAYWLICKSAATIDASGISSLPDSTGVDGRRWGIIVLYPGWNQISSPFAFPVNWADCVVESGIENSLWAFSDGWLEAQTLEPFQGYFVKNNNDQASRLIIPYSAQGASAKLSTTSELAWSINISARQNGFSDDFNTVGAIDAALDGLDRYDRSSPPPFGDPLVLSIDGGADDHGKNELATDIRANVQGEWEYKLHITTLSEQPLTLAFDCSQHFASSYSARLSGLAEGINLAISSGSEITIPGAPAGSTRTLWLKVSRLVEDSTGSGEETEGSVNLMQNYPNPFNASTQISFALPSLSQVDLKIINLLGQEVRRFELGRLGKGAHHLIWDGRTNEGAEASTGVYFYTLTVDGESTTRKMIFLR